MKGNLPQRSKAIELGQIKRAHQPSTLLSRMGSLSRTPQREHSHSHYPCRTAAIRARAQGCSSTMSRSPKDMIAVFTCKACGARLYKAAGNVQQLTIRA